MASSNRRENADPTSEKGETDVTVGLENSEGENKTNMDENSANVQPVLLGTSSFKVEGYQMEVTAQKAGSIWLLKCGDKEIQHKEEIRQSDGLDFHDDILIIGEKAYQLKEEKGYFLLDIIDDAQLDQENNRSGSFNGDDSGDEKEIVSVNPCIGPSHQMLQLSNQNSQNTQRDQNSNIHTSQSTEMDDDKGTRFQNLENLPGSEIKSNTDLVKTAENTSRASDQSLTDKTCENIAGASPALPPTCPNSSVSSTDDYENVPNLLPPAEDPQSANQSTSIKDNSGTGKSTLPKKPMPTPRQHKGVKLDPLMGRINSIKSKNIQTEPDEELFIKERNGTERMQQSCDANCSTGAELGESRENPCGTQKSEETISGRKNEGIEKEYKIHLSVKYWKSKHFSSDWSTTCNLDKYLRWHYVLENSQALSKKLDQLKAKKIHVTVEKEEEYLWVNIDLGRMDKTPSEIDSGRIKATVMEALMPDTDTLVTNSFPAIGIDRNEAVKLIMKTSKEKMRNELWLYPDEDTDFIHYVYPATRSSEVDTCIQEVTKLLQEGERIEPLQLVFSKLFEQNSVKQEMKRVFEVTLAIDCLESENRCKVTIKGRMSQVEKGWSWIKKQFLDNYTANEIGFKDIRRLGTNITEEIIAEDVFSQAGFEHVTWCINESCKKIGICSTNRPAVDKATEALKRGIKKREFPLEVYQSLCDVQAVKEGRAILEKADKSVKVSGTDKALTEIKQFMEKLQNDGRENKTTKTGQINKDNNQSQLSEVTEATVPFVVDDSFVFRRLCESEKLKHKADKYSVRLSRKHAGKMGFLLTGSSDNCVKFKEILCKMIASLKLENLKQENFAANRTGEQWTLSNGHCITVQYPTNKLDVNFLVAVHIVPPEQAKYDRGQKTLCLPAWTDGCKKEAEKTETCLKELLMFSLEESSYKIQIDLPKVHVSKKIAKRFIFELFALLSGDVFKEKPPVQLYICTDSEDMYMLLIESCKNCERMPLSTSSRSTHVSEQNATPTPEIEISIISGQLNGTKADVIVNTTSTDLNLSNGKVSGALLHSAGQELQSEVKKKCPKGIQFGEIVVTKGYGLQGCNFVFHGAVRSFSTERSIRGLYKFVVDCLSEADRLKCESIAFPAIGTGKLGYSNNHVACAMFSAVRGYEIRNRNLRQVLFVIYHEDLITIKEFRKHEECNDILKELTKKTGKVRISIDYGTVTDVFTTSIIYVWERQSSYNAKLKEHALLSHVGDDVQKLWKCHSEKKDDRDKPLITPAGQLPVSCIAHVFCQGDLESLRVGITEGLQQAHSCDSVTLFFDEKIKLLNYGESVVDVFQECIKGIQMSETSLRYVSMSLDNIDLVAKFQTHLTKSSTSENASGRSSLVSGMSGRNNREPEDQSITDRGDDRPDRQGKDQIEIWKTQQTEFLAQGSMNVTNNYVWVKDIPPQYTESDLKEDVEGCCSKLRYFTIFVPGMSEAIIKCTDKKDTTKLVGNKSKRVEFVQFPPQSMKQFSIELEDLEEQTAKSLEEKDIYAKVKSGKTYITTPTKLQLQYALEKLEKAKLSGERTRYNSEGFTYIIEVTEDVWDIVQILKEKDLNELRRQGKEISYNDGCVTFSGLNENTEDPNWIVVKSCLDYLKRMQILEVAIEEQNVDTINKWCHEIQKKKENECCIFVKKRKAVLMFDYSYENLLTLKHQLLIKDGQIKLTGRGKRIFNEKSSVLPAGEQSEPHNSESNIVQVVEAESKSYDEWNQKDRATQKSRKKQEFNLQYQARNFQEYDTAESIKVYVYEANILKLPVDCIVNAANDTLQHGGGVAKVIAVAAGRSLDKEGFAYIGKHGKIQVGKTCVTTAGNLHYDCVIHAVGPRWSDYSPHSFYDVKRCEKDLYSAIVESLLAAEERHLESIALPAISAAIFGVPEELCVYHYAKATIDYSKRKSPTALKEIHFIDINQKIIRSIQHVFDAFLRSNRDPEYTTDKFVQTKVQQSRRRSESPERTEVRGRETDTKLVYTYYSDGHSHIIETQKCKLIIQHGDIMQIKATAIVSIEDSEGSGRGKISKLIQGKIKDRNKDSYKEMKKQIFAKDKKTGEVIVTDGFSSGYKYILHAVLPYDIRNVRPVDRGNTLKQTLKNILKALDDRSVESIVMCLLGAGEETKEEIDVATDAFIKTFKTYCEKKSVQSKHLQITLFCRQGHILNWVVQKFRDHGIIEDYIQEAPPVPPRPTERSKSLIEDNDNKESLEDCVICMEKITKRKVLKCGHAFDKDCIKQAFRVKKVCPTCGMVCGKLKGDQPEGKMKVNIETYSHCAGYEQYGRITITYTFESGKQGPDHPNPGRDYKGITRIAYLPDNDEGNEVLEMLRLAFDQKLIFTIGSSRTTGEEGVITWNDIHHKTDPKPNTQFGYPDPTYLARVKDELSAKGITPQDICKAH